MKKVAKAILFGIIICCLVFALSACVDNDKPTPDVPDIPDEPIDTSAYGQLTETEKKIFDVLVKKFNQFVNPTSVRILAVDTTDNAPLCDLKLQATNKLGGTVTAYYYLWYEEYTNANGYTFEKGLFRETNGPVYDDGSVSVGNLNKAIVEYWEEQGLL